MKCSMCSDSIPKARTDMGYTICVNCSTEEKKVGGYKGKGSYKHYKELTVSSSDTNTNKTYTDKSASYIKHISYNDALKKVLDYYDEWGYERTLQYLRTLNSSGDIPLMTRVKIQDIVSERYINPSPRALKRKFNSGE